TSVGIPALTPEMIAEHAKARAKAKAEAEAAQKTREKAPEKAPDKTPGPAPPETPAKSGIKGTLIAVALFAALFALAWYVYQQQVEATAQRASILGEVNQINIRINEARQRLGRVDPGIAGIPAGPQHDEAVRLRDSVLKKFDDVTPLVQRDAARPETVAEARTICDRIDADLSRIETMVSAGTPTPAQNPG